MVKERMASLWAKLVKKYRLVLYDHESLSQSRHLIFKPIMVITLISGALIAVSAITSVLIFKVPAFHRGIPGYQSHLSEEYKSLQRKNMDLEREVAQMDSMIKVFSAVMGAGNRPSNNGSVYQSAMPEPASMSPIDSDLTDAGQRNVQDHGYQEPTNTGTSASGAPTPTPKRGPVIMNLVPPIDGYVTKDFEPKDKPHFGIDLAAEENSLVRSVADGVVVFSEYSNTTGYVICVWHSKSNLLSFYKHNSRLFKTVGSYVFAGEAIAVIGNTGINSSGTHLHFELWYDNNPVNPADFITFN
jgi:murein DD-endopeptidase MepM/ murein hydrolase activator NlpD